MMQTRGFAAYILDLLLSLFLPVLRYLLPFLPRDRLLYKPGTMHGRKDRHTRARYPGTNKHPITTYKASYSNIYIVT